ncbi:MAG: glyoxylate reductase, partial [Variibacter sp.]|nr:glyoxylate reductase [Variibacter sp.]
MSPRIFVTQPIAESALARLRAFADVTVNADGSRILPKPDLIAAARTADILFVLLHDVVDRDVLAANPTLRGVVSMTITPDRIDVAAATELGIPVTNIPAVVTEATADLALALMLAVARRVVEGDHLVRKGMFPGAQSNYLAGGFLFGKTLGLIGAGRIGLATARRARGFSMRILYADPRRLDEATEREL